MILFNFNIRFFKQHPIRLYSEEFFNTITILPPPDEQIVIANYLDDKTTKIDTLIEKKKKLIELLKEERTAVINQAVTRGINPNVKLKDSGIDWLGQIPEHWEVKKLKYVANMLGGFAFQSSDFVSEGIQLIKIANLYQNEFKLERQPTFLPDDFKIKYKEWVVSQGDILISMTGTLGKRDDGFAIRIEETESYLLLNQRVSKIKIDESQLNPNLGLHILRSNYFLDQLFILPSGTKQGNLSHEQICSINISFPENLHEQLEIIKFIETETKKIDETISKIEKEIALLAEYRTALISEAVTGKIKIIDN